MKQIRTARTLGLKNPSWNASPFPRKTPIHVTFGPAGEAVNESAEEDATAEWLTHVEGGADWRRLGAILI